MTDFSAAQIKGGQPDVPLIERRQGKSAAHHMCLDVPQPNTLALHYPNALPKLETISPGKELPQKENKKRVSTSRMDLELQELKGFMELGFEFSKDQLTPRLLFLLPGLKRLIDHESSSRILGFQESPNPNPGVDMKEHLKLWARSVASTRKC